MTASESSGPADQRHELRAGLARQAAARFGQRAQRALLLPGDLQDPLLREDGLTDGPLALEISSTSCVCCRRVCCGGIRSAGSRCAGHRTGTRCRTGVRGSRSRVCRRTRCGGWRSSCRRSAPALAFSPGVRCRIRARRCRSACFSRGVRARIAAALALASTGGRRLRRICSRRRCFGPGRARVSVFRFRAARMFSTAARGARLAGRTGRTGGARLSRVAFRAWTTPFITARLARVWFGFGFVRALSCCSFRPASFLGRRFLSLWLLRDHCRSHGQRTAY